ncbi:MAG: hypothetical protein M1825_003768 [Sarcosagium campestre]|nr:MAG: hypothetical protein M1825_003768 [Sarcosagium campestre]
MATSANPAKPLGSSDEVRRISLSYSNADSQTSALRLILTLRPEWQDRSGEVEFIRFTDGITNTLLKAIFKRPGISEEQIDEEAVLLRAFGKGTDVLIDRNREFTSHSLLSRYGLAPTLLARFENGLLYKFIRGKVCSSSDLTREVVWRGVARRLGEWHAVLPVITAESHDGANDPALTEANPRRQSIEAMQALRSLIPTKPSPNIWEVMQKWILALPTTTQEEKARQVTLQEELKRIVTSMGDLEGLGKNGLVFGHCDLLSGNVIVEPKPPGATSSIPSVEQVSFIDYEYATPSPATFDIANHFAEWGGLECDFNVLPSRSQRRGFLEEYVRSYEAHLGTPLTDCEATIQRLFDEVDAFRGVPGFYWGIWALIQATISQIDFDYAAYAEVRLGEYWAWKAEVDGSRAAAEKEIPLRERAWARGS